METNYLLMSKKELIEAGQMMGEKDIENGRKDILQAYLYTKSQIDYLTAYLDYIHDAAMNDFEHIGEKEHSEYGRRVSKFEAGTKYDFSKCGHPKLDQYEIELNTTKVLLDGMKDFVKRLQKPFTMVDEETGETFEVRPPIKTSTTKLKVIY